MLAGRKVLAHLWYYWVNDEKRGPVSGRVLRDLADIGKLQPATYVMRDDSSQRVPAIEVPNLFKRLGWFFTQEGIQHGPVSDDTLRHLVDCKELSPTDNLWKEGMSRWVTASKVRGLFTGKTRDENSSDLYVCETCGELSIQLGFCFGCGYPRQSRLVPGTSVGLIGMPCSGKTCYLAALHDQLMHSSPDWRVRVSDRAFETLTNDFWAMSGGCPPKTLLEARCSAGFFSITVIRNNQTIPFVLNDMAGEHLYDMKPTFEADDHRLDQNAIYFRYLRQCRGLLVAIPCWNIRRALEGVSHIYAGESNNEWVQTTDQQLSRLFRELTSAEHHVKHVEVVLVGVDVYGGDPLNAVTRASESFERIYRSFPGVLRNAGVTVGSTPVSNIGFNNEIKLTGAYGAVQIVSPPEPFNVLTPLQRILEPGQHTNCSSVSMTLPKRSRDSGRAKVFLSYRRENGAETARLLKSSLESVGWQAFLDVDDLGAKYFDDRLLLEIQQSDAFILILSPGSLDRCAAPDDWLRREVLHALKCNKRIVLIRQNGFSFPNRDQLPLEIASLSRINFIEYSHHYFQATFEKLLIHLTEKEVGLPNGHTTS